MKRIAMYMVVALLVLLNAWQWWRAHPVAPQAATPRPRVDGESTLRTATVAWAPVATSLSLGGQVSLTEHGRADVTVPINGTVARLDVKVGQHVEAGAPVAVLDTAFGQTPLQMMQRLEQDQAAVLQAQNQVQQAQAALGQQQAAVAQAETALSQARDNLRQAEAELANASGDYRRKRALLEGGVASRADVDDARERYVKATAVAEDTRRVIGIAQRGVGIARDNLGPLRSNTELARRTVALAQTNLARDRAIYDAASGPTGRHEGVPTLVVRAPVAGVVTAVPATVGQTVGSGAVLASVADTATVYVDASAYDSDLPSLKVGDPATVRSNAAPDRVFSGKVESVGSVVDANTRTAVVRLRIDNRERALRPGTYVSVEVRPARPRRALMVPTEAVLFDGERHMVAVQRPDGRVERRVVEEGTRTRERVEIVKGLSAGERIVTHGNLLVVSE